MATRIETHPITDQVVKSAHETLDRISGPVSHAEESLRETTHKAQENIKATAKKTREGTKELTNSVTEYIQENPFTAVGIAAAVGIVAGVLLRR